MKPSDSIATPRYVLIDQKTPLGPRIADSDQDTDYWAIFGFSDKTPYDSFCLESSASLTPYPLVKGYLRNQLDTCDADAPDLCVKLVVLDAAGPRASVVHAATIQAVLDAQQAGTTHIIPTHHLTFNPEANVYRLDESRE